ATAGARPAEPAKPSVTAGEELPFEDCFAKTFDRIDFSTYDPRIRQPGQVYGSAPYRPSREELAEYETLPGYVRLAAKNRSHFPTHSWSAYSEFHGKALRAADAFRLSGARDQAQLIDALLNEAFAQHFLHDSFASGHIGTEFGSCFLFGGIYCT